MKKTLLINFIIIIIFIVFTQISFSVAATDNASSSAKPDLVKELKDRLATRVAQLRNGQKKAISGKIKSKTDSKIILTTANVEKTISTSDDTVFIRISASGRKEISLNSLQVSEMVTVFGQENLDNSQTEAKVIIAKTNSVNINGKVIDVDTQNGTLTVNSPKKGQEIVDIETTTKIMAWQEEGFKKYGLSKIKVGDRVHVNGFTPEKLKEGENRLTASRVLVLPGNAFGIIEVTPSATPSAMPKTNQ